MNWRGNYLIRLRNRYRHDDKAPLFHELPRSDLVSLDCTVHVQSRVIRSGTPQKSNLVREQSGISYNWDLSETKHFAKSSFLFGREIGWKLAVSIWDTVRYRLYTKEREIIFSPETQMVKCYLDTVVVLYTNANSLGIFTAWSGGDILKIDISTDWHYNCFSSTNALLQSLNKFQG